MMDILCVGYAFIRIFVVEEIKDWTYSRRFMKEWEKAEREAEQALEQSVKGVSEWKV
jgi:hypothetical protein